LNSSIGAVCYAEIGTIIPRNGAEVAYLKEGIFIKAIISNIYI
jgi:amino acid transporter